MQKHLTIITTCDMIQTNQRKGVKQNMRCTTEEAYELKLIDELAHEKFSWSSIIKAFRLAAMLNN